MINIANKNYSNNAVLAIVWMNEVGSAANGLVLTQIAQITLKWINI